MPIFSVNHWVAWKGKVRGNHTTLNMGTEGGEGSRKGRKGRMKREELGREGGRGRNGESQQAYNVLWSSVGFDLFRRTATSYEYVLLLGSHKHPLAGPSDNNLL